MATTISAVLRHVYNAYLSAMGFFNVDDHHFYAPLISSQSIVVDLGANEGHFSSEVSAAFGCRCYCVEAGPDLFAGIKETSFIKKFHFAVSATDGPVTLHLSQNPGVNSIFKTVADSAGALASVTVPGTSLENFLRRNSLSAVDLLKLDIEGAELEILKHTPESVLGSIRQISVEFHDFVKGFDCQADIAEIKQRLARIGFFCLEFSLPYRHHMDVLFINQKLCSISGAAWLQFYFFKCCVLKPRQFIPL